MSETRVVVFDRESGVVSNHIVADPATYKDAGGGACVAHATAQIGWTTHDGGKTFVAPPDPEPTAADLMAEASDTQNRLLGGIWSFDVGTKDAPLTVTTRLNDAGSTAMLKLLAWSANAGTDDVEAYSNVDLTPASLTPAQARSLALQAGAVESQTFKVLNAIAAAVAASPPTITTTAQVKAAGWPTPGSSAPASSS